MGKKKEKEDIIKETVESEEVKSAKESESLDEEIVVDDENKKVEADEELIKLKDAAIAKLNDQIKRNMAEFDNFRKRSAKEKSQMLELGASGVVEKLLPVIDNFERAMSVEGCEGNDNGFRKGIELIYKQFLDTLDQLDVKEIDALHKPFDPNLHHAVAHEVSDEYDENIVTNVMQKGYTYKDKVIRYSMVSVAN